MDPSFCGYDETRYDIQHKEQKEAIRLLIIRIVATLSLVALMVVAAYLFINKSFEKSAIINNSMHPTLEKDDTILINKLAYKISDPKRFDVIILKKGDVEHAQYDCKRVYGLPGETIQIINGVIYVNNEVIKEEIHVPEMELAGIASFAVTLDGNQYFVLADNRNEAEDSRYSNYGLVSGNQIVGKAWLRTNEFGIISMFNLEKNFTGEEE